jgi:16S rRNA (uracil1498-N3)-methyltransferase
MRLSRFFIDTPLSLGQHELPETQAHYIGRVLRHAVGDAVQLFDGSGNEFLGELIEVGKKKVRVELREAFAGLAESPLHIHLGQGLSRGERMDWAIQKASELGANAITPIVSERCEVRLKDERADKRMAHWRQVAISACEQCGRSVIPLIHPPLALADWLGQTEAASTPHAWARACCARKPRRWWRSAWHSSCGGICKGYVPIGCCNG